MAEKFLNIPINIEFVILIGCTVTYRLHFLTVLPSRGQRRCISIGNHAMASTIRD